MAETEAPDWPLQVSARRQPSKRASSFAHLQPKLPHPLLPAAHCAVPLAASLPFTPTSAAAAAAKEKRMTS